jgi:hypothetical protein
MKDTECSTSRLPDVIFNVPAKKKTKTFLQPRGKVRTHTNDPTADGNKI